MSVRTSALIAVPWVLALGCAAAWHVGPSALADPRAVAAALGDPPPQTRGDLGDLPQLAPPHHPRFCCAFGMDMQVDFAGLHVPFFQVSNIVGVDGLGAHAYELPDGTVDTEPNGLVYTCRGGWIDTSHVRENADTFIYLALRIARDLSRGCTIEIPGHGAPTTLTVAPVPDALVAREGVLETAAALAAWATYRISIWHEVSTWYGYESVAGFSERPSTFSIEDLYSNVLGIHLGRAVLAERAFASRGDYDAVIAAFLLEALGRLAAQPVPTARAIMGSLDGRWWSSRRHLPDDHLVLRRFFPPAASEIRPWRAEDAFEPSAVPEPLARACGDERTRPLTLPSHVGATPARELVVITWAPEAWADARFPFADASRRIVDERELERLVLSVHDALGEDLGPGFDAPSPLPEIAPLEASAPDGRR